MNKRNFVLTATLAVSLFFSGWMFIKNKSEKIESSKEKSVLLAEKDLLNSEINNLTSEKKKLNELNTEQKNRIDGLLGEVDAKNNELHRLIAENAKNRDFLRKLKELEVVKNELRFEVSVLHSQLDKCNNVNLHLENELALLKTDNDILRTENTFFRTSQIDDLLIKGVKKSEKLTAFARWTRSIRFTFDFPENHINNLDIRITTPNGSTYTASDKEFVIIQQAKEGTGTSASGVKTKKMEVVLLPEKKFKKGNYSFTILSMEKPVSTMQIQLK